MANIWKIAPGQGAKDWPAFRDHDCIGLGWLPDQNYSRFDSSNEVLHALRREYKNAKGARRGAAEIIWQFVRAVKPNDIVVANRGYNGVLGVGIVTGDYHSPRSHGNPMRGDETTHRHHVRSVDWQITKELTLQGSRFFVQSTLWPLTVVQFERITRAYRAAYPNDPKLKRTLANLLEGSAPPTSPIPEEILMSSNYTEGNVERVLVNRYERDPRARRDCISHHGANCSICNFDFGREYGEIVEGLIHVHHLRSLADIGSSYTVDPVNDLRPVCPNCHAVLHARTPEYSIEDVRGFRRRRGRSR